MVRPKTLVYTEPIAHETLVGKSQLYLDSHVYLLALSSLHYPNVIKSRRDALLKYMAYTNYFWALKFPYPCVVESSLKFCEHVPLHSLRLRSIEVGLHKLNRFTCVPVQVFCFSS